MSLFDWHKDLEGNILCNYENWSFFIVTKYAAFWIDTENFEIGTPAPFWFEDLKEVNYFTLIESYRDLLSLPKDKSVWNDKSGLGILEYLYGNNIQRS